MEELQCSLLGFSSASLPTASPTKTRGSDSGDGCEHNHKNGKGDEPSQAETILEQLHPSEQSLIAEALPLGEMFRFLRDVVNDASVGRTEGLYISAIGAATATILELYEESVVSIATPTAVAELRPTYFTAFAYLSDMIKQQRSTDLVLSTIRAFLMNREISPAFRACLGNAVWMGLLYTIGHYVAHGVVLHGHSDFFISMRLRGGKEEHTLHSDLLPPGVSVDLAMLILTVGKERRVLLTDGEGHGHDSLERLANGVQDEAADAVFRAIYNASLCPDGVLAVDELETRVEAARQLWSKALWLKVGDQVALHEHLAALRAMFLCQRGDLWHAFVEGAFPAIVDAAVTRAQATEGEIGRAVADALAGAMVASGLGDTAAYERFGAFVVLPIEESSLQSVEGTAQAALGRVRGIGLRYTPPRGLHLIVSQKALEYYQRIFSFHIARSFSLHALHAVRRIFSDACVTNLHPSIELRRLFALMQLLLFIHTTLGYHMQVDVIMLQTTELCTSMEKCRSVGDAKQRLDRYVWNIAEGSFITESSGPLLAACEALFQCAIALYVLCTRYRLTSWAVDGSQIPVGVSAALAALETRVHQDVVAAFTGHLAGSATSALERALWARLDFNRYLSATAPPPSLRSASLKPPPGARASKLAAAPAAAPVSHPAQVSGSKSDRKTRAMSTTSTADQSLGVTAGRGSDPMLRRSTHSSVRTRFVQM